MFDKKEFFKGLIEGFSLTVIAMTALHLNGIDVIFEINYASFSIPIVLLAFWTSSILTFFLTSMVMSAFLGLNRGAGITAGYAIVFASTETYLATNAPLEFYLIIVSLLFGATVIYPGAKIGGKFHKKNP